MITPVVKKYVPRVMKNSLARVIKQTQDRYWRARFGRLSSLVPPLQLMHDGGQSYKEFKQNGDEFLRLYKTLCGLQPHEHMLDVGSGVGRKTWPLVNYLNEHGSYDGMDLVKSGVDWCTERYTSKYPNFNFTSSTFTTIFITLAAHTKPRNFDFLLVTNNLILWC